jgi:hypothetical protein
MNLPDAPIANEGFFVTHFFTVRDHVPGIARCVASSVFRRYSSSVIAVCVNAPVRICAGGDQRWSSLPRQ